MHTYNICNRTPILRLPAICIWMWKAHTNTIGRTFDRPIVPHVAAKWINLKLMLHWAVSLSLPFLFLFLLLPRRSHCLFLWLFLLFIRWTGLLCNTPFVPRSSLMHTVAVALCATDMKAATFFRPDGIHYSIYHSFIFSFSLLFSHINQCTMFFFQPANCSRFSSFLHCDNTKHAFIIFNRIILPYLMATQHEIRSFWNSVAAEAMDCQQPFPVVQNCWLNL